MNKSWTDRWRSAKLSPSARHDPFQRHVGSNQRAKKSRATGEREGEGFTLKYVDPRAILGLFSLHPAGCSGRIPVRHAGRESVYRMIQKHRIIFLSLWTGERRSLSPASFLLFFSARRPRACDHHYTRPPSLVPISLPPPLLLVLLLVLLRNLLPSSVLFTSHPAVRISSTLNYVSAKRVETKALLTGGRLINCNAMFALERGFLPRVFPDPDFFLRN